MSALRSEGFTVYRLNDPAIPDLLVSRAGSPHWLLLEVKTGAKGLTKAQERFFKATQGANRYMVNNAADALAAARYWLGGKIDG